jgi:hypothetical protein
MGWLGLAAMALGAVLVVVGLLRARGPWGRYQALKAQDENVARYEAWRGGVRNDSKTGASVAMEMYRREARIGVGVAIAGVVLVVVGLFIR